ncbi:MAG: Rne/Rng family ribonuclease [Bacteroidetes bacterium]|nr:Rne/Rng family ribonuclease [Bacteroidota bacterium]MBT6686774.1 Rne/Rng family ribonuclease [Bacteroidota bacterium]MBT7141987.1 Rne/Rng family ribonuclease [Bacteroidota bacterium]MBT7492503.1 Rne/Rng family ribonuclease [Bacteroidota bacterium]
MNNELVIDVTSKTITIALLKDRDLIELNKDKPNKSFSVGDIYLGKVKKLMPGLNAAFIDIGYKRDAFLHYLDLGHQLQSFNKLVWLANSSKYKLPAFSKFNPEDDIDKNGKISQVLSEGNIILVQIAKEPISSKGPRLGGEISLPGRNIVLIPFSNKISISQKIRSQEERQRLKEALKGIVPNNYGIIVRTAAKSKTISEIDNELKNLISKWEKALIKLGSVKPPELIIGELNRTSTILRDVLNSSFNSIYINDESTYKDVRGFIEDIAPEKQKIVKYYNGNVPIFEQFGVDKQIKSLFGKTVTIKNGIYLVIEHTEALHVIDVNSGNRSKNTESQELSAIEVNLEAADEIARQLRLRDMGGIIVIDFIDMRELAHRKQLYARMKEIMAEDPSKHSILPLSKFGIMQITRQRVRPEMNIKTVEKCPTCKGSGEIKASILIVDEIENNLKYIAKNRPYSSKITLKVHNFISAYLTKGFWSLIRKWRFKHKIRVKLQTVSSYGFLEYHFTDSNGDEIIL